MLSRANKIRKYILKELPNHSKDIVAYTADYFKVSRTTIHRHLNALIKQNQVIKSGTTRQASYLLFSQKDKEYQFEVGAKISEGEVWRKYLEPFLLELKGNVSNILHYCFTEVFNNAIDHAQAKTINVNLQWQKENIAITVQDNGIGIFKRISRTFHFNDYKECLLHLTKGKLTTDPIHHTGEGLFFTSRALDEFYLIANGLSFYRNNLLEDWTLEKQIDPVGTKVVMIISCESSRKLVDLFNKFTELETFSFNKTELLVDLCQLEGENLISRSQAKRLLSRLEPFQSITLDFSKVISVGQGFVDEIFRVYKLKNPQVDIQYVNANEEVAFMIARGIKNI